MPRSWQLNLEVEKKLPRGLFLLSVFIVTGGFAETAQEKEWLSYQPTVVELKGTLTVKTYYGPPNYGENPDTDAREELPILILKQPINVRGNPDPRAGFDRKSVADLQEVQLVLTTPHKEFIGKRVVVKGTLFHGFTGHHHTDVLMDVRSIKLAHMSIRGRHSHARAAIVSDERLENGGDLRLLTAGSFALHRLGKFTKPDERRLSYSEEIP